MNEFCESCPGRGSASCVLPGDEERLQALMPIIAAGVATAEAGSTMATIGEKGGPNLFELARQEILQLEAGVDLCVERHQAKFQRKAAKAARAALRAVTAQTNPEATSVTVPPRSKDTGYSHASRIHTFQANVS